MTPISSQVFAFVGGMATAQAINALASGDVFRLLFNVAIASVSIWLSIHNR